MLTHDTQHEQTAPAAAPENTGRAGDGYDAEFALLHRLTIPVIICATPAFLVAIAGAWFGNFAMVLAGGSALGLVQLVWLGFALVTLRRMARSWFIARRTSRRGNSASSGGTGTTRG